MKTNARGTVVVFSSKSSPQDPLHYQRDTPKYIKNSRNGCPAAAQHSSKNASTSHYHRSYRAVTQELRRGTDETPPRSKKGETHLILWPARTWRPPRRTNERIRELPTIWCAARSPHARHAEKRSNVHSTWSMSSDAGQYLLTPD